jgi:hypothetical protein
MLDEKLEELGKYAEELEKLESMELVDKYLNKNIKDLKKLQKNQLNLLDEFKDDITKIINNYSKKNLLNPTISYYLFIILVSFIKISLIEEKANSLHIDRRLYKNEMSILFKGRWK